MGVGHHMKMYAVNMFVMENFYGAETIKLRLVYKKKPRWTHIESRGCTNGKWVKIGTARSLNEAKQLMLNHQDCQKERSALFYSPHYSYDASWSVRCVLAEHSATCTENNRNWQAYVLTYQK